MVGKICLERIVGMEVIRSTMEKIWRVGKSMVLQEIGENYFMIIFVSQEDKNRVLDCCP